MLHVLIIYLRGFLGFRILALENNFFRKCVQSEVKLCKRDVFLMEPEWFFRTKKYLKRCKRTIDKLFLNSQLKDERKLSKLYSPFVSELGERITLSKL